MQLTTEMVGIIIALVGNAVVVAFYGGRISGRLDELSRNVEKSSALQKEHGEKIERYGEQIAVIETRCGINHATKGEKA